MFEIQLLSLIGGMICTFLKLGDGRLVIKEMIPWNMILVICGVGTLIGVASNYGVVQMVAEWVGSNVSGHGLTVIMTALGGILSFVSDGMGVCMPTFYPMIASIASSTGIAIGPMFLGFTTAIWATAAAPCPAPAASYSPKLPRRFAASCSSSPWWPRWRSQCGSSCWP